MKHFLYLFFGLYLLAVGLLIVSLLFGDPNASVALTIAVPTGIILALIWLANTQDCKADIRGAVSFYRSLWSFKVSSPSPTPSAPSGGTEEHSRASIAALESFRTLLGRLGGYLKANPVILIMALIAGSWGAIHTMRSSDDNAEYNVGVSFDEGGQHMTYHGTVQSHGVGHIRFIDDQGNAWEHYGPYTIIRTRYSQ